MLHLFPHKMLHRKRERSVHVKGMGFTLQQLVSTFATAVPTSTTQRPQSALNTCCSYPQSFSCCFSTTTTTARKKLARKAATRSLLEDEIPPNAFRRKQDPNSRCGFSLGVDLGLCRTGLAISKGFSVRPLMVLELRGQKLELRLLDIAAKQEVDEFIIGLPRSSDGSETPQSNKVRSVAGRLAVQAAEKGWRVYLQDEYGTSADAMTYMIEKGLSKSARQGRSDAYAAVMVLERYFSVSGEEVELVLPKQLNLQNKLRQGPKDLD